MKTTETAELLIEVLRGVDALIKQEAVRREMGNHMAQNMMDIAMQAAINAGKPGGGAFP